MGWINRRKQKKKKEPELVRYSREVIRDAVMGLYREEWDPYRREREYEDTKWRQGRREPFQLDADGIPKPREYNDTNPWRRNRQSRNTSK